MKITGKFETLDPFEVNSPRHYQAEAPFVVVLEGEIIVTRYFSEIAHLPDDTPVIANCHKRHATKPHLLTMGELKAAQGRFDARVREFQENVARTQAGSPPDRWA